MEGLTDNNSLLLYWSSKLDSTIHPDQVEELWRLKMCNSFLAAFGKDEIVPTGSCVEGSKVNVPGDIGDIDFLIISGRFVLNENLFEYIPHYPAFLTIPVTNEHFKLFKEVALVEDKYLPISVLKDLKSHVFDLLGTVVRRITAFKLQKDDSALKYTRHTAVGLERRELDGVSPADIGVRYHEPEQNIEKLICQVGQFINDGMDRITEVKTDNRIKRKRKYLGTTHDPKCHENTGDTLFRIASEITHKIEHIDEVCCSESEDETIPESGRGTSNTTVSCSRFEPTACLPYPTLNLSESINDELEMRFDDMETSSTIKDAIPSEMIENIERSEAIRDTYTICDFSVHSSMNIENKESANGEIYVPCSRFRSTDFVPAFRFTGWPGPAEEWIRRRRHWPPIEVRDQIIRTGCQVIAKPLPFMKENENKVYFRLSFALSETILANCMTESQNICWRILKAYQKGFLCTDPRVLASYHWKTALLWISETKSESFWTPDNVIYGVSEALEFMIDCLTKRCVPHYFVRNMNLIADCDIEVMDIMKEKVTAILRNPVTYLKRFVRNPPSPKPCKITEEEMELMRASSTSEMFDEKSSGDFLDLFYGGMKFMKEAFVENEVRERFFTNARNFTLNANTEIQQKGSNDITVDESTVISGISETACKAFDALSLEEGSDDDDDRWSQVEESSKKLLGSVGTLILNRLILQTKGKQLAKPKQGSKIHTLNDIELD